MNQDTLEKRRFAKSQKAAMQRLREEHFCKIDADDLEEDYVPAGPPETEEDLGDMAYVDELGREYPNNDRD